MSLANSVVVLDFETTGLSPSRGDRAIEIGAVKLIDGEVVDTFQALMNPGKNVSSFIEQYTGITNTMLKKAQPCETVMSEFAKFIGNFHLVAHNASFDKSFLDAEFNLIKHHYCGEFACSVLLSRRISPEAPNHKLATLVDYHQLPQTGQFHRALADATMTAELWLKQLSLIESVIGKTPYFDQVQAITQLSKHQVPAYLQKLG